MEGGASVHWPLRPWTSYKTGKETDRIGEENPVDGVHEGVSEGQRSEGTLLS